MAASIERSTRVLSRMCGLLFFLVAGLCLLQVGNLLALRKARVRLQLDHEITDLAFQRLVHRSVSDVLTNYFASLPAAKADSVDPVPQVIPCDLSTWETVYDRRPRALIDGVECGIDDYCTYGLVKSIRRGRVVCLSDGKFVLLCSRSSSSVPGAGLARRPDEEEDGNERAL